MSMGWAAARKLRRAIDGLTRVLAIEVMTAARGLALRAPLEPGAATGAVVSLVAGVGAVPGPDRFLSPEIEAIAGPSRRVRSSRRLGGAGPARLTRHPR